MIESSLMVTDLLFTMHFKADDKTSCTLNTLHASDAALKPKGRNVLNVKESCLKGLSRFTDLNKNTLVAPVFLLSITLLYNFVGTTNIG